MLLKVDNKTWIEIPNNSTEEFKNAKLKEYKELKAKELESLKEHSRIFKSGGKVHNVGALYDKRVNLANLINNLR